jgi:hypothetical protein
MDRICIYTRGLDSGVDELLGGLDAREKKARDMIEKLNQRAKAYMEKENRYCETIWQELFLDLKELGRIPKQAKFSDVGLGYDPTGAIYIRKDNCNSNEWDDLVDQLKKALGVEDDD